MRIEKVLGKEEDFDLSSVKVDRVFFDHESISKGHQRVKTESGRELMISIEHGESLFCGAVLYRDDELAVLVDMRPEDAIEIKPRSNIEWARAAFLIGNMHASAFLHEDCILAPYDESLLRLFESSGIPWKRVTRKLTGFRAGMPHSGHSHERH